MNGRVQAGEITGAGTFSDYLQLVKPRLTSMALATTLVGFFMASPESLNHGLLLWTLLGAGFIGAGANGFNQFLERDIDAKMRRTEARPLPSGRLNERAVVLFSVVSTAAGVSVLALCVNGLTAGLGALTFVTYAFIYTPLKKLTPLNTYVGAIPGALPVAMGWTAAAGRLETGAVALFFILFVWQIPHFYAIAWVYREDYLRGGLRMVTGTDETGRRTALQILGFCLVLVPVSWLPTFSGLTGWGYFAAVTLIGGIFLALAARLVARRMEGAKPFVSASIFYLAALIVILMADKA